MYENKRLIQDFLVEMQRIFSKRKILGEIITQEFGDFVDEHELLERFHIFLSTKNALSLVGGNYGFDYRLNFMQMLSSSAFCYTLPFIIESSFLMDDSCSDDIVFEMQEALIGLLTHSLKYDDAYAVMGKYQDKKEDCDYILNKAEVFIYYDSGRFFFKRVALLDMAERKSIKKFLEIVRDFSCHKYGLWATADLALTYEW